MSCEQGESFTPPHGRRDRACRSSSATLSTIRDCPNDPPEVVAVPSRSVAMAPTGNCISTRTRTSGRTTFRASRCIDRVFSSMTDPRVAEPEARPFLPPADAPPFCRYSYEPSGRRSKTMALNSKRKIVRHRFLADRTGRALPVLPAARDFCRFSEVFALSPAGNTVATKLSRFGPVAFHLRPFLVNHYGSALSKGLSMRRSAFLMIGMLPSHLATHVRSKPRRRRPRRPLLRKRRHRSTKSSCRTKLGTTVRTFPSRSMRRPRKTSSARTRDDRRPQPQHRGPDRPEPRAWPKPCLGSGRLCRQIVRDSRREGTGRRLPRRKRDLALAVHPRLDLFDLNRVETLRGPQALSSRSGSVGGTIRYITNPTEARHDRGLVEAISTRSMGDLGYTLKGAINLPLGDTAAPPRRRLRHEIRRVHQALGPAGGKASTMAAVWVEDSLSFGSNALHPHQPRVVYQNIRANVFNGKRSQPLLHEFNGDESTTRAVPAAPGEISRTPHCSPI